jgi:hypothetical protein
MSSEKKFSFKLNLDGPRAPAPAATYENFRLARSGAMGEIDAGKIGMPVTHAFESNHGHDIGISEVIEHTQWPQHKFPPKTEFARRPKYELPTQAVPTGHGNTFEVGDQHHAPREFLEFAKQQPKKPFERRNLPGLTGDRRGEREPLKFKTKQVWVSDQGVTIPNSGFEIRKKVWFEGQRTHVESGEKFDLFKMRVSKTPSAVAIDFNDRRYASGAGGRHRSKHHVFIGIGADNNIRTAKRREDLIAMFGHRT